MKVKQVLFLALGFTCLLNQAQAQNLTSAQQAIAKLPIYAAHTIVHQMAEESPLRSLPMFNYTYYASGFCKDQDCSEQKIKTEIENAKKAMGADFQKHLKNIKHYEAAIKTLQRTYHPGDLSNLGTLRSAEVILKLRLFVTAIDATKAILYGAQSLGADPKDLKFYVLMVKEGYLQMCPARDGRKPTLPRPIVYSDVAFRYQGNWYLLNPENPTFQTHKVGTRLPNRLSFEVAYEIPAPMKGKTLTNAGSIPLKQALMGFPSSWLISATAEGSLQSDVSQLTCR